MSESAKDAVRQQFAANADKYVTSRTHAQGDDLGQLAAWLRPGSDWVVLDVATGAGHTAKAVCPHVAWVVASDLTRPMLATAARHLRGAGCANVSYVVADAEDLPFLDAAFDAVTCRIAPHHFPSPQRFVAEAARVLRPGGSLLLIDNVAPDDADLAAFLNTAEKLRDRSHIRCASVPEWRGWLGAAGLSERRSAMRRKFHAFDDWVRRATAGPEQRQQVEAFFLAAPQAARRHFEIRMDAGAVAAWAADEWMTLWEREEAAAAGG